MERETSCCFTGHRRIPAQEGLWLRRKLREEISALAEGETLEEATFRGNVIGAIQITHRSDNEGLPTREQLSKIILEGTA